MSKALPAISTTPSSVQRNRRGFLGALLGLSAGAGAGVLLPLKGGVVAVSAEAAAAVPAEAVAMPFSSECLELRSWRRKMLDIHNEPQTQERGKRFYNASVSYQQRVLDTMIGRPRRNWAELIELAECAWQYMPKEEVHDERGCFVGYTGRLARDIAGPNRGANGIYERKPCSHTAVLAELVETILDLGNGERLDPKMSQRHIMTRSAA